MGVRQGDSCHKVHQFRRFVTPEIVGVVHPDAFINRARGKQAQYEETCCCPKILHVESEHVRLHLAVLPGQHAVELPALGQQPAHLGFDTVFLRLGNGPGAPGKRRRVLVGELQVFVVVVEGRDVQAHAPIQECVAGAYLV